MDMRKPNMGLDFIPTYRSHALPISQLKWPLAIMLYMAIEMQVTFIIISAKF